MRILVVRIAAFGDVIITTPLIRQLKEKGHEVYYLGSEQAQQILEHNPNVDKFIYHERDSVESEKLGEYFDGISKEHGCDRVINLCESIEVRLAVSRDYPHWNWSKRERAEHCDINYYEYCFTHAQENTPAYGDLKPEMFFSEEEHEWALGERKKLFGFKTIMWGLSGSGRQKVWPYVPYVVSDLIKAHKDLKVILVGGVTCQVLEAGFPKHERIIRRSGEYTFRQSALLSKYVDLVVSPDTGFLHASGCWETPKIGLLTHTTIENITKHFENDYSLESEAVCAPCFRLVQNCDEECPLEVSTSATLCMGKEGMKPERVMNQIEGILCHSLQTV